MAGMVGKYAANKMLRGQMAKYQSKNPCGDEDPFFAYVEDPRKPGKKRKVKKTVPAYIPEHDANILAKMRRRSYRMDMALFEFLGTRFGWSSVIGIIPAAGDAVDAGIALLLVKGCMKVQGGLPMNILIMMLFNVAIDFLIGLVPFLGDIADAYFKANTKNCRLLEKHLDDLYKPDALRTSGGRAGKPIPPATAYEDFSEDEEDRRAFIRETNPHTDGAQDLRRPAPTADRQAKKSGGWFGLGGGANNNNRRQADVERGELGRPTRIDDGMETGTVRSDRR